MAGISARQREFQKEYEKLCYRFHRWEVWKDFVVLVACSISNSVDKVHAEAREALYMDTIRKYSREEADTFPRLFALITLGMEKETGKCAHGGARKATAATMADKTPEEMRKPRKTRKKKPEPEPLPEPRPEDEAPTFTVSVNKKNAGQLMFDFG